MVGPHAWDQEPGFTHEGISGGNGGIRRFGAYRAGLAPPEAGWRGPLDRPTGCQSGQGREGRSGELLPGDGDGPTPTPSERKGSGDKRPHDGLGGSEDVSHPENRGAV